MRLRRSYSQNGFALQITQVSDGCRIRLPSLLCPANLRKAPECAFWALPKGYASRNISKFASWKLAVVRGHRGSGRGLLVCQRISAATAQAPGPEYSSVKDSQRCHRLGRSQRTGGESLHHAFAVEADRVLLLSQRGLAVEAAGQEQRVGKGCGRNSSCPILC